MLYVNQEMVVRLVPAAAAILDIMAVCGATGLLALGYAEVRRRRKGWAGTHQPVDRSGKDAWRMPPLAEVPAPRISTGRTSGLTALRTYLLVGVSW